MKVLTFRLGQFALCGLFLTVIFRYALHLCIGMGSWLLAALCSVFYFSLMYFSGWYFGRKDEAEYGIHDIGFRWHFVTYLLCNGVALMAYHMGWHTEALMRIYFLALFWGIGLAVHFIYFLKVQKGCIKGYAKDEIFQ